MQVKISPIQIYWCPRGDRNDSLFYWGKSWQMSAKTLDGRRVDLFGWRIQLWVIRILLCCIDPMQLEHTDGSGEDSKA